MKQFTEEYRLLRKQREALLTRIKGRPQEQGLLSRLLHKRKHI